MNEAKNTPAINLDQPDRSARPEEIRLIEKMATKVGMTSLLNNGAASCVYSEGCNGVSQEHLIAFVREIIAYTVITLSSPAKATKESSHG